MFFRKKANRAEVDMDERDKAIGKTATLGGALMSYVVFIFACMITWEIFRQQGKQVVSIHILPTIVAIGGMVFFVGRSIAILVLYGREPRDG